MNRPALLFATAILAAGCVRAIPDPVRDPDLEVKATLTAEPFKTPEGTVIPVWRDDEELSMYDGIERRRFIKAATPGEAVSEFTIPLNQKSEFYYVVRAREATLISLKEDSFVLQSTANCGFTANQSGQLRDAGIGVGLCTDPDNTEVAVRNIVGGVRFSFVSKDAVYAEFSTSDNKVVADYIKVDISGSEPTASFTGGKASKIITVGPITPGTCYITMLPGTFANGVKLRLLDEDKFEVFARWYDGPITVTRSEFLDLGEVDTYRYNYFQKGDGSAANPYQIMSAQELKNLSIVTNDPELSKDYNDKCFLLAADVDCSQIGSMEPVGRKYPFKGVIDGASHTITKFACNDSEAGPGGFVGILEGTGTVKDVKLAKATIAGSYAAVGGIVGQMNGGTVSGCSLDAASTVTGSQYNVGGIVGYAKTETAGVIEKCAFMGSVTGTYYVGGIIGQAYSNPTPLTIRYCGVSATVTATDYKDDSNCYVGLGGIAGYCYPYTGGLLTIESCFCAKSQIISAATSGAAGAVGGIFGYTYGTKNSCMVSNCYASVSITAGNAKVGLAGSTDNYGAIFGLIRWGSTSSFTTVKNCYYPSSASIGNNSAGKGTLTGNEALSDAAFTDGTLLEKLKSTATGASWVAGEGGYPVIEGLN